MRILLAVQFAAEWDPPNEAGVKEISGAPRQSTLARSSTGFDAEKFRPPPDMAPHPADEAGLDL